MNDTIIPERGTKAFAEYKAGVEWEHEHGAKIEFSPMGENAWSAGNPLWQWGWNDYRVALPPPEPHPIDKWRAMTKEERAGKVLEQTIKGRDEWTVSDYNDNEHVADRALRFDKENRDYRIREISYRIVEVPEPPKPRYVPWTRETCPVGAVVFQKMFPENRYLITAARLKGATLGEFGKTDYDTLWNCFAMSDGSKCGTQES